MDQSHIFSSLFLGTTHVAETVDKKLWIRKKNGRVAHSLLQIGGSADAVNTLAIEGTGSACACPHSFRTSFSN